MNQPRTLVSFDLGHQKSILRDKANYDVLEGFLSTLLERDIRILSLLESESSELSGAGLGSIRPATSVAPSAAGAFLIFGAST